MISDNDQIKDQGAIDQAEQQISDTEKDKKEALKQITAEKKKGELSIKVKVHSPYRVYFQGQALSVSAENETGPFDILPRHNKFICLLKPCDLIVRTVNEGDKTIQISGGVMHVKSDMATVFLDI